VLRNAKRFIHATRYAPVVEEYKETLKIENYDGFLEKIYGLRSRKKD